MKRLYKSRKNKVIDGVCGGIAEYFDADPVLVRVIFVLLAFAGGSAIIAYIVGMIIIPVRSLEEEAAAAQDNKDLQTTGSQGEKQKEFSGTGGALVVGIALVFLGAMFVLKNFDFFNFYPFYWLRHHFWEYFIPGLLIVTGVVLIRKSSEKK